MTSAARAQSNAERAFRYIARGEGVSREHLRETLGLTGNQCDNVLDGLTKRGLIVSTRRNNWVAELGAKWSEPKRAHPVRPRSFHPPRPAASSMRFNGQDFGPLCAAMLDPVHIPPFAARTGVFTHHGK